MSKALANNTQYMKLDALVCKLRQAAYIHERLTSETIASLAIHSEDLTIKQLRDKGYAVLVASKDHEAAIEFIACKVYDYAREADEAFKAFDELSTHFVEVQQ